MDFDFLSSNLQIAYPFKTDVEVTRPDGDEQIVPLVAALRYYTFDQREALLYVDEVDFRSDDGFATLSVAKVELRWSDGTALTLEDGVTAAAEVYSYGAWIVVTLRHTAAGVLPAVMHVIFPADQAVEEAAAGSSSSSSSSSSADATVTAFRFWKKTDDIEILSSLVEQGPGKVRRVFIKRGAELSQVTAPGEEIAVGQGFNMSIESQDPVLVGGRQLTPFAINAVPGAGAGRYLICARNAFLRTLSGVPPTEIGGAILKPEECYWLERDLSSGPTPLAEPRHGLTEEGTLAPNELQLHNSCGPCCSCEDYIAAYEHLRDIWDRAVVVSGQFYEARDDYNTLLARYEEIINGLSGLLTVRQIGTGGSGKGLFVLPIVNIRNETDEEIPAGVVITLELTPSVGSTEYVPGTGFVSGPSQRGAAEPTDPDTNPVITLEEPIPVGSSAAWMGLWELIGMTTDDELEVMALVSNGVNDSSTITHVITGS